MGRILALARVSWLEMIRRKDIYVLLILQAVLLLALISVNVFDLKATTRYVADIGLLVTWLLGWILAVLIGGRQLPDEEVRGTIYPLLAKPLSRAELVVGKWLGAWWVVSVAVLMFYALVSLVVVAWGGRLNLAALAQGVVLHCIALGVMAAVAVALSSRMNRDAATTLAYVVTGGALLLVPNVPALMQKATGPMREMMRVLYHLLPHFEVLDLRRRMVHDFGPAPGTAFGLALFYGVVLIALFLLLAWVGYRQKRFVRGAAS
jgi:ABC-type transport system involved in multi-copper enzyme maturation permease subunit